MNPCLLVLLLAADVPAWQAAGEGAPWICGRQLPRAGFEKWRDADDLMAAQETITSTPRGQRAWIEGMVGRPGEDLLGRALPGFVTRARAVAWAEHPLPASVDLVTARRWPGVPGERWVILVAGKGGSPGTPAAELTDVRLALVEVTASDGKEPSVRRIARTPRPLAPCADWEILAEDFRPTDDRSCEEAGFKDVTSDHTHLTALDFAPYRLTPTERAFGVRTTLSEGYGGGFGTFETLTLFRVDGDALLPILDVPVGVVKMTSGNWNEDGTRQHQTIQADLVIDLRARGKGMADLLLRSRRKHQTLPFAWDPQRQGYACRPRSPR